MAKLVKKASGKKVTPSLGDKIKELRKSEITISLNGIEALALYLVSYAGVAGNGELRRTFSSQGPNDNSLEDVIESANLPYFSEISSLICSDFKNGFQNESDKVFFKDIISELEKK